MNGQIVFTPELNLSIRANNLYQRDNLDLIISRSNLIEDEYTKKGNDNSYQLHFQREYNSLQSDTFKYYEKDGDLLGAKVVRSSELEKNKELLSSLTTKGNVAFITDNVESNNTDEDGCPF